MGHVNLWEPLHSDLSYPASTQAFHAHLTHRDSGDRAAE
jgi:hypothetical protein